MLMVMMVFVFMLFMVMVVVMVMTTAAVFIVVVMMVMFMLFFEMMKSLFNCIALFHRCKNLSTGKCIPVRCYNCRIWIVTAKSLNSLFNLFVM